jgi:hypothetical protein
MHIKIATAVVLSLAFAPQQRGWVSSVTASGDGLPLGTIRFTVAGTNPCGAVSIDYGDGSTAVTHAIERLPVTFSHEFTRVGEFRVRARGQGNCDGDIVSPLTVARVRAGTPAIRFGEQDQNRDGVITRAEWRGTAQEFDDNDWNNDGRLSGDEVRMGVSVRFGDMDQNRDGIITRNEWRGNAQAFDQRDWNNDGRLSGDEVRIGAQRTYDWTEAQFRRFDRNRDNYLSGTEWRYEPENFAQVDRNRDDRVSLNEFLAGDNAGNPNEMPGGRGRGWGRGNTPAPAPRIVVNNRTQWTDTGIDVRAGDLLDIDASGMIRFSPGAFDTAGPNGAGHLATARAPLPRLAIGALIGRVGNSAPFLVGENRAGLRAPATGRLQLGINDDNLSDNSGQFIVTVTTGGRGRGR